VQSLGGGRICVASFGGAARAWLTKYKFVDMFGILEANMSCCHLSLFYRYRALPGRPASGRARTVASCGFSANRMPPPGGYTALSILAIALGRSSTLVGAGAELLRKLGPVYEAQRLAQHAGCCLGGTCGAPAPRGWGCVRPCRAGVVRCARAFWCGRLRAPKRPGAAHFLRPQRACVLCARCLQVPTTGYCRPRLLSTWAA
jgi:hypothetical protein